MRQPLVWLFNGTVVTITLFVFAWHMVSSPQASIPQMPRPAAFTPQAAYLALATSPMGGQPGFSETPLQLLAYPLDGNGNPNGEPIMFFSQPIPSACNADQLLAAPNGRFLTIQYNCHADEFARLLPFTTTLDLTIPPNPDSFCHAATSWISHPTANGCCSATPTMTKSPCSPPTAPPKPPW